MAQTCEETQLHESRYVQRRKDLLALANQLHSIGAQDVIDVPRITVIGKQSAGKSSVVEAISGIKVPRDAGTCTRCPLECRLQSTPTDTPWSCKVSIRKETVGANGVHTREPEVPFGTVISDKSKVEEALRRAQYACLNPTIPIVEVLSMREDELRGDVVQGTGQNGFLPKKRIGFSRNVVCVDIQGPGLPDLSFIDLPGLIQNADQDDIRLVEDLVKSNIQGNCLILATLPVTDDIENQKALLLAQTVDPSGRRTIGVLTKPDLLPPTSTSSRQMWLNIIEGRQYPLKHGYYCVRQPDDSEREAGITRSEARDKEDKFFESNEVWKGIGGAARKRLGTDRLIECVGDLLVQVINESLPRIRMEASANLTAIKEELSTLPPVLDTDPSTYMLTMLTSLSNDVLELVRGGPDNSRLIHGNREAFEGFKDSVRGTCPRFVATASVPHRKGKWESLEELLWNGEKFCLGDMKEHITRSVTRELRGNVPYQAKVSLITASQKHWPSHALECYNRVRGLMMQVLYDCVQKNFQQHERILGPLKAYIDELVQNRFEKCLDFLEASLEMERSPFTQNDHYLDSSTEKWLARYREERESSKKQPQSKEASHDGKVPDFFASTSDKFAFASTSTSAAKASPPKANKKTTTAGPPSLPYQLTPSTSTNGQHIASPTPVAANGTSSGGPSFAFRNNAAPSQNSKPFWETSAAHKSAEGFGFTPSPAPPTAAAPKPTGASSLFSGFASGSANTSINGSTGTVNGNVNGTVNGKDQDKVQQALAALAALGYAGLTEEDLGKLNPADEYETELKVMAEVRGYFQVSYKRIIDNIPSLIDLKFVRAVGKELQPFLISKFELGTTNGNNRCAALLAEDAEIVERREQLMARKKRLESVQAELFNFGM